MRTVLGLSKEIITRRLTQLPADEFVKIKEKHKAARLESKRVELNSKYTGVCEFTRCGKPFTSDTKRQKYCSNLCTKLRWEYDNLDKKAASKKRLRKKKHDDTKLSLRGQWKVRFFDVLKPIHKQHTVGAVEAVLKKIDSVSQGIRSRSKGLGIECNVTLEDLRLLILDAYGKKCKFCDTIITRQVLVVDHQRPVSKGGTSNLDNLQVICKTCNGMKGSLDEANFELLLEWLNKMPKELAIDLRRRLCGLRF